MPKLPEDYDKRKKLTVRKMVGCLINYGFTYREMAKIFGVSYSLFGKLKIPIKEATQKRYRYKLGIGGNTKEYRLRRKEILKDKQLKYFREFRKQSNDKTRKNKFTKRMSTRKFAKSSHK